jgi:hypothetical protein
VPEVNTGRNCAQNEVRARRSGMKHHQPGEYTAITMLHHNFVCFCLVK